MKHFLAAFLTGIVLLAACGKNRDAAREASSRQPSATAIAVQSSAAQTSTPAPIEQEKTESASTPPTTFKDEGACPFEGCIYRQWKAEKATAIHAQPDAGSPVFFSLKPGEWVTALTGFVLTSEPGIFEFKDGIENSEFKFPPGAKVYVYTYEGEGSYKAWFNGRFFDFDPSEDFDPAKTNVEQVKKPVSTWWVNIKNGENQEGWTSEGLMHFSNSDQLGGEDLSPTAATSQ